MRNIRKSSCNLSLLKSLRITDEKIKDVLYIESGIDLNLEISDAMIINELLKIAYDMHEMIESLKTFDTICGPYFIIPITRSCYDKIENIICRYRPETLKPSCLYPLAIEYNNKKYYTRVQCLFETDNNHYYLFTIT